jgi:hypothetical protein
MPELCNRVHGRRFGQHYTVWPRPHDGHQIVDQLAAAEAVETHPQLRPCGVTRSRGQEVPHSYPRCRQLSGRNRVFEVEDQRIRAGSKGFRLLSLTVPRHEQQRPKRRGAHTAGFLSISAARRQEATSSLRWL